MSNKNLLTVLVVVGTLSFSEVSSAVRKVFPVRNYATVEIGRVSKKPYSALTKKAQVVAQYTAKSKAIDACELAATSYQIRNRPPSPNPRYDHEFEFTQNPNTTVSPIFLRTSVEQAIPVPDGLLYSIDLKFQCNGRWRDLNPNRFDKN